MRVRSQHGWTKAAKGMIFGSGPWKVSSQSSVWCVDKAENSSRMRLKVRRDFENEKRDTTTAAAAAAAAAPKSKEEKEKQAHNEELVLKAARTNTGRVIHKEDFRVTRSDVEKWVSETDGPDKVALRVECEYIRPNKTVHGVFVVSADDSEITFREVGFREIGAAVTAVAAAATATATIMTMRLAKLAGITAAAASATSGSSSTSTSSAVGQRKVGKDNDAGKRMVALLIGDESGDGNSSNIAIRGGAAKEGQRQQKRQKRRITKTWKRGALRAVHMRRYRLAHTALEVFFDDSTSVFLNFATPDVKMYVYRKLVTIMPSIAATSATPLPLRYVDCATPAETLCSATVAAGMTQQWVKGQLSNFDYLMCLNTIAGRSYNDIDQYPVFPWVLADYTSEVLDLTNPKTFRDLSKPIGALIPKVRASNGEAAAAAYPSMYSSADIVLHYMARLEPFASCPRTSAAASAPVFRSVREEWEACISNGNGGNDDDDDKEEEDRFFPYRELTPEFFCSPEFLRNGGEALADVELPPWAHGSADEFVRVHRAALESEYVSAHLHEWIDLIFGYKQTGGEARKADNVFFWSSYEGAIDLAKVPHSDRAAVVRAATRRGLAPAMLLAGPHPAKSNSNSNNKTLFADPENVRSWTVGLGSSVAPPPANGSGSGREEGAAGSAPFITRPLLPVAHVRMFEGIPVYKHIRTTYVDMVGTVNSLGACGVHSFGAPQKGSESAFRVEIDTALTERTASLGRDRAWSFAGSNSNSNSNSSVTSKQFAFTPDAQYLFECGFWDNSLRFVSVKTGQVLQTLKEHRDTVTCVAVAPGGDFVFTGSRDTTLMCWAIHWPANGVDDPSVSPHPRYVLCGHAAPVTALDFSADLDLVVSGDEGGTIVAHTLREGRFIWAARLAKGGSSPISHVRIAGPRGDVVAYSRAAYTLAEYNINGRLLCRTELAAPFNDIAVSADGGYIVLGGHNAIMLRAVQNLRLVYNYSIQGTVTSLSLFGGDRCLAAGMLEGNLLIINKKQ